MDTAAPDELTAPDEPTAETQPLGVRQAREQLKRAERERRSRERREQRRFGAHRRRRRRAWAVGLAAVLGLALFVAAGVFTPIMAVRSIEVRGAVTLDAEELRVALSRFEGVPLALVRDDEVHRALEPFPLIQRYAVERIPPSTLVVRVEERSAAIAFARGGGYELFDPAGVLLAKVAEPVAGVPLGDPGLGDSSSPEFRAAAAIVRDMPEDLRAQMVGIRASSPQDVSFTLTNGTEVVWGDASDTQRKAVVLRSMQSAVGAPALIDVSAPEAPVFR